MAMPATNQNQQLQMNPQEIKANNLEKPSRRSWLHKATMAATGAVVLLLVLTGCTKEHLDQVIGKLPGGGVGGSESGVWYNLRVTFNYGLSGTRTGFMGPIDSSDAYLFYDAYMQIGGAKSKFKLHPTPNGWAYWEIDDGNWLSLTATGWAYRSSESNKRQWRIINGKLYNSYWASDWQNYPLGCEWDYTGYAPPAFYVGVGLSPYHVLTCELVPAE